MTDDIITPPQPSSRKRRFSLDDLLGDSRPQAVGVTDLPTAKEIRLDRIQPDPNQPRRFFDPDKLKELAASIRIEGVLQPVVVRYDTGRDVYVMLHGERRWRAAKDAGLTAIPALVRDVPEDRRLIQQLMENIVRDDLNAVDRAAALRALKGQLDDAPWDKVAEAVGIRRSRLFQLLGTEKLPESIQADIRAGRISEKQSRALQGLPGEHQRALRDAIIADDLTAETALAIARKLKVEAIPDDLHEAAAAIARIRRDLSDRQPAKADVQADVELLALLGAISKLATGNSAARVALIRLADWNGFEPFDNERFCDEIYALAQTLARIPSSEARDDASTCETLVALRDAITGLLEGR
jgi:ParB family transcriptional regulator, chromosome partitioning protein